MNDYSVKQLNALGDSDLKALPWRDLKQFNARLLELHSEGELGNLDLAKLPRKPILCVDNIEYIDDTIIEASFTFPANADDWAIEPTESLEMLFQDQLDQLVGFWSSRKADGIGRALSSGLCHLHTPLHFEPGRHIKYRLTKRKWMKNVDTAGGTAVFNGEILDENDSLILKTKNIIVGIVPLHDVQKLRKLYGGNLGVDPQSAPAASTKLTIPIYDSEIELTKCPDTGLLDATATQQINPDLWPFHFHFIGDPVVPGNFGTHGMISLLKQIAREQFNVHNPEFMSLDKKNFSGMIFEDPKQIRFELAGIDKDDERCIVAARANLYLENSDGTRMIEDPIYMFKNLRVGS